MNEMDLTRNQNRGFTLIELLLYISLSGLILFSVSVFMASLLEARIKNQTIATVEQEGNQVMALITQTLRNATDINSPATGITGGTLSVDTEVPANTPTIFTLSGGVITIKEGVGAPVALTSNLVVASNLIFHNLSRPSTPGDVHLSFTLTHVH